HHPVRGVEAARNKLATRMRLEEAGLPVPPFTCVSLADSPFPIADALAAPGRRSIGGAHLPGDLRYPCVLKPLDLAASRGVIRADDPERFVSAFQRIALMMRGDSERAGRETAPRVLVEEFVPGAEVALEGLLRGGTLEVLALFDKPDPLDGPFFEETIYVTPSRHPPALRAEVERVAAAAARALGLVEGPVHAELRLPPGGPVVLEVAARSIGGLCSRTLRFGAGLSLEEVLVAHALGLPLASLRREARASGVMMLPIPRSGILHGVAGIEAARAVPGVEDVVITVPEGHEVVPLPEGDSYLGFLFARGERPEEVEASLREGHRRLAFDIRAPLPVAT
ncbi:MAG TPA: ATP-grasp domain-containing protein, partial [Anaeromyxobacter sp.]|nr:ATP-grasp domain-containing protein [Anaeromyxobacter sp.]